MLKSVNFWRSYRQLKKKFSQIIEKIDFYPKNEIADKSEKIFFSPHKKNTCFIISIKEQRIWVSLKNKFGSWMDRLNWDAKHPLNLQARRFININYYNIYICNFTQYYLSMFRNKKIESCLFSHSDLFWDVLKK